MTLGELVETVCGQHPSADWSQRDNACTSTFLGQESHFTQNVAGAGSLEDMAGALFLLGNFGGLWWWSWTIAWPLLLIGLGLGVMLGRFKHS